MNIWTQCWKCGAPTKNGDTLCEGAHANGSVVGNALLVTAIVTERDTLRTENERLRRALEAIAPMFDNDSTLLSVYAKEIEQARKAIGLVS